MFSARSPRSITRRATTCLAITCAAILNATIALPQAAASASPTSITTQPDARVISGDDQPRCTPPTGRRENFRQTDPAALGFDPKKLAEAVASQDKQALTGVTLVIRHGCLAAAHTHKARDVWKLYQSWSAAKGLTAVSAGVAMSKGQFSWDESLSSLIPEAGDKNGSITFEHLANQNSGWKYWHFNDIGFGGPVLWNGWFHNTDVVRHQIGVHREFEPGKHFDYQQAPVTVAAEMVTRAVGEDIKTFDDKHLMKPLGIQPSEWTWQRDRTGRVLGFQGVEMAAPYWARIGQMMLDNGTYAGKQIVSPTFVRKVQEPSSTNGAYSHFFWVNSGDFGYRPGLIARERFDHELVPSAPRDMYEMHGMQGQLVAVIPSLDMVIVRNQVNLLDLSGIGVNHLATRVAHSIVDGTADNLGELQTVGDTMNLTPEPNYDPWAGFIAWLNPIVGQLPARATPHARAISVGAVTSSPDGLRVQVSCPSVAARQGCEGNVSVDTSTAPVHLSAGESQTVVLDQVNAQTGDAVTINTKNTAAAVATSTTDDHLVE